MTAAALAVCFSLAQGQASLDPGRTLRLTFPELPKTYAAMGRPGNPPTVCTVRLPDNYSKDKKFPLFVYLEGGRGNGTNLAVPRAIAGDRDTIVASFPLFRREHDENDAWNGLRVAFDDYPVISKAYKAMLDRLRKEIPNIDSARSVMGGNSNGGHTIAILLSMLDQNTLDSFRGFFLIDGGFEWNSYHRTQRLKNTHLLFLVAEGDKADPYRKLPLVWAETMRLLAKDQGMKNWRFEVMSGLSHGLHREHYPVLKTWMETLRTGG